METRALEYAIDLRLKGYSSTEIVAKLKPYDLNLEEVNQVVIESDHFWLDSVIHNSNSSRRRFPFWTKLVLLMLGILFLYPQFTGEVKSSLFLLVIIWIIMKRSRLLGFQYIDKGKFIQTRAWT